MIDVIGGQITGGSSSSAADDALRRRLRRRRTHARELVRPEGGSRDPAENRTTRRFKHVASPLRRGSTAGPFGVERCWARDALPPRSKQSLAKSDA